MPLAPGKSRDRDKPVNVFQETSREVAQLAAKYEACIVSFSGGKDSLACLDLCCKAFRQVVALHMWFVPGLACIESQLAYAKERWGVPVVQLPHWGVFRALKHAFYRDPDRTYAQMPDVKLEDVYNVAREDLGIRLVVRGGKASDSLWRRRMLNARHHAKETVDPLRDWNKFDILAYLALNKIPVPDSDGKDKAVGGVGLATNALLWLHDRHPEDFAKVERMFPYVGAVVARREFYGVGQRFDGPGDSAA